MKNYGPETYGERIADAYDELYDRPEKAGALIDRLVEYAGAGPVLELAVGTGRIAVPLAERGVAVRGIDVSPAMLEKLRARPNAHLVRADLGDITDFDLGESYDLIFIVFNSLFCLVTQEQQLQCFSAVARHLSPTGRFLIEAFVPDLARFDRGQRVNATHVGVDRLHLDVATHDVSQQRIDSTHLHVDQGQLRTYPVAIRYAWPAELDLMARLSGLRLVERWGGWEKQPFTAASASHVSLYGR